MTDLFIFEWWGVIDAGLLFNREIGDSLCAAGDIEQAHFMIGALEVWAEHDRRENVYRLELGREPQYLSELTRDQFIRRLFIALDWAGRGVESLDPEIAQWLTRHGLAVHNVLESPLRLEVVQYANAY